MKNVFLICLLLLNQNFILAENSSYDYSSYTATSVDTSLTSDNIACTTTGQSAVYITKSGITIKDTSITKSGDIASTDKTENSEFYGINAAVLVQGGSLTMTGGSISTSARGGNALVATNSGSVTISGTTITSTGSGSARGLHATYGGKITADSVTITTQSGSCATLATDRGEGTVSCTKCTLTTNGAGSPIVYSTGEITLSDSTGNSNAAQAVVVEGKNSATIKSSTIKCKGSGNGHNDECGVLIYQSQSGDAASGTSSFTCDSSTIEIDSSTTSAPMFYVTNTACNIDLTGCTFIYQSGTFLKASTGDWGSNGGTIKMTLTNQEIEGDFVVDASSSLTLTLVNSSIKGKINNAKTAGTLAITLDAASKITLTGDSYYTSLNNADSTGANIDKGSYTFSATSGGSNGNDTTDDDSDEEITPISTTSSNFLSVYKNIVYCSVLMVILFF